MKKPKFITLKEASEISGVSYYSLRTAILTGRLTTTRFTPRGKYHLTSDNLKTFIDNNSRSAKA